jgi:N-acetylglucosamine kinase-like BadF-type ATPase
VSTGRLLAVDGGNSKTDVALLRDDGALLAYVRAPASSLHKIGLDGVLGVLEGALDRALAADGTVRDGGAVVEHAQIMLAGADLDAEEQALRDAVQARGWAERTAVANDTFAVLRAGTDGWGIGITCGAGINCVGVGPDGRHVRFPALGAITGDWGGGGDLGLAALSAAARSEDGRGPATTLERAVPAAFGLATPWQVAEALHTRALATARLVELAPVVLAEARTDAVAAGLVERLAHEIVAFARATIERLALGTRPVEVFLGGGLMQAGDPGLLRRVEDGLHAIHAGVAMRVVPAPPIVGAALLALDAAGADAEALARGQRELAAATASA